MLRFVEHVPQTNLSGSFARERHCGNDLSAHVLRVRSALKSLPRLAREQNLSLSAELIKAISQPGFHKSGWCF